MPETPDDVPLPPGLVLAPFRALRFDPTVVGDVAQALAPPYDVVDEAARGRLEQQSPYNAVRLVLPREEAGRSRYEVATERLAQWRASGALRRDATPALYVYEETEPGGHVQRGLLGGVGLARADAGIVLPHENTMAGPVADRLALLTATATDLEPIFLVYDGGGAASEVSAEAAKGEPLLDTVTEDGVRHRLTSIVDPAALAAVADDLTPRVATIADGHHRYATYLQHQEERHRSASVPGPWDYGLTLLVDATVSGPAVHPIHRTVRSLPLAEAVSRATGTFQVRELGAVTDPSAPEAGLGRALAELARTPGAAFLVTDGTRVHLLDQPKADAVATALPPDRGAAWRGLDVTIAHRLLIDEVWGLQDHEDVVGFEHDVRSAVATVRDGGTALLLKPTPVESVAAVARAGDRMPRKSTLFTPKPRSGVVLRPHS